MKVLRPRGAWRRLVRFAVAVTGALALISVTSTRSSASAAPKRPLVDAFETFDYASLPLLERTLTPGPKSCGSAVFRVGQDRIYDASPHVKPAALPATWTIEGLPADSNLRIGRAHFVSRVLSYGPWSTPASKGEAEWVFVDRGATTEARATMSRCVAKAQVDVFMGADAIEEGFARALVPGRVYAYRRCVEGCDAPYGSAKRAEELGVVTSPALWISSSGWGSNGTLGRDAFSRGYATIRPGATATIVVGLPPANDALGPLRSENITAADMDHADTFDIEVVWPEGAEPTMTMFRGRASGTPALLAVGPR